jgi:hypothetical protein
MKRERERERSKPLRNHTLRNICSRLLVLLIFRAPDSGEFLRQATGTRVRTFPALRIEHADSLACRSAELKTERSGGSKALHKTIVRNLLLLEPGPGKRDSPLSGRVLGFARVFFAGEDGFSKQLHRGAPRVDVVQPFPDISFR